MDAYPQFDLSKVIGSLENLRPISRDGNRVTYDNFVLVGASAIVEVKKLVMEFPQSNSVTIEQVSVDEQGATYKATALSPRVVSVEFGKIVPY